MFGLLCAPSDPMALAAALNRLYGAPELCARLGQAARATVLQDHTWSAVVRRILSLACVEPAAELRGGDDLGPLMETTKLPS